MENEWVAKRQRHRIANPKGNLRGFESLPILQVCMHLLTKIIQSDKFCLVEGLRRLDSLSRRLEKYEGSHLNLRPWTQEM